MQDTFAHQVRDLEVDTRLQLQLRGLRARVLVSHMWWEILHVPLVPGELQTSATPHGLRRLACQHIRALLTDTGVPAPLPIAACLLYDFAR